MTDYFLCVYKYDSATATYKPDANSACGPTDLRGIVKALKLDDSLEIYV